MCLIEIVECPSCHGEGRLRSGPHFSADLGECPNCRGEACVVLVHEHCSELELEPLILVPS